MLLPGLGILVRIRVSDRVVLVVDRLRRPRDAFADSQNQIEQGRGGSDRLLEVIPGGIDVLPW